MEPMLAATIETLSEIIYKKLIVRLTDDPADYPCWLMVIRRYDNVINRHLDNQLTIVPVQDIDKELEIELMKTQVVRIMTSAHELFYLGHIAAISNKFSFITRNVVSFLRLYFETFEKNKDWATRHLGPLVLVAYQGQQSTYEIHYFSELTGKSCYTDLEMCDVSVMRNSSNAKERAREILKVQQTDATIVAVSKCREYLERNVAWLTKRFALKKQLQESGPFCFQGEKLKQSNIMDIFYQTNIDERYMVLAKLRHRLKELITMRENKLNISDSVADILNHIGLEIRCYDVKNGEYRPNFNYVAGYISQYSEVYQEIVKRAVVYLISKGLKQQMLLDGRPLAGVLPDVLNIRVMRKIAIISLYDCLKTMVENDIDPATLPLRRTKSRESLVDRCAEISRRRSI